MGRDGYRREAPFVTPCASGISSALWPAGEQCHVATSWLAQLRRSFIMRGIGLSSIVQHLRLLYPFLILTLSLAGIVLAVLIFQYWMILFALASVWSVLIVFITRLLCDKFYSLVLVKLERRSRSQWQRSWSFSASPQFPETPMPATPLIRVLETIDLSTMDVEQFIENEDNLQTSTQISIVRKEQAHPADISP